MIWIKQNAFKIGLLLLSLYVLPFCFPSVSHVFRHDNLDSIVSIHTLLANSGYLFALHPETLIEQVMNGLPRGAFPSFFNVTTLFYVFFSPFFAYTLNTLCVVFLAYIGMYLLLDRHVFLNKNESFISASVAFCFACLPIYSVHGLSFMGIPLLAYAFLTLYKREGTKKEYGIILLFALYSSLVLSGVFVCAVLCGWVIWEYYRHRQWHGPLLLGTIVLIASYIIIEYQLLWLMLGSSSFVSHRSVWGPQAYSFVEAFSKAARLLFRGQEHTVNTPLFILLGAVPFSCLVSFRYIPYRSFLLRVLASFIGIAIIYGLSLWQGVSVITAHVELLRSFQWNRFYAFYPTLTYLIFALALYRMKHTLPSFMKRLCVGGFVVIQLLYIGLHHTPLSATLGNVVRTFSGQSEYNSRTFQRFYSADLFTEIKAFIGRPLSDYRVVSIGLLPSIASYNGFYTLDGYYTSYDLHYKKEFRKIMEHELDKNKQKRDYFDEWGSRCYIFIDETGNMLSKGSAPIQQMDFNTQQFKKMGGNYVLSGVKINHARQTNLILLKLFRSVHSPWDVYLYGIADETDD